MKEAKQEFQLVCNDILICKCDICGEEIKGNSTPIKIYQLDRYNDLYPMIRFGYNEELKNSDVDICDKCLCKIINKSVEKTIEMVKQKRINNG